MRHAFAESMLTHAADARAIFLTVDVGFMALEKVREAFGRRFINVGVAEQNLIGVAAGLAREGFRVFAYSIAPFLYARPFEQIRNDLCFSRLNVCMVGNGGGYAYGYMGPTHHALEDCAAMSSLGVRVVVPAFDEDLRGAVGNIQGPTYLRLGLDGRPSGMMVPPYAPWRKILEGKMGQLVALGPMAGVALAAFHQEKADSRPSLWAVAELGDKVVPKEFWLEVSGADLFVVEEQVRQGGLGAQLAHALLFQNIHPRKFIHRHALGYPSGTYGSQGFHRQQCGLDFHSLRAMVGLGA
jgi:transketolase